MSRVARLGWPLDVRCDHPHANVARGRHRACGPCRWAAALRRRGRTTAAHDVVRGRGVDAEYARSRTAARRGDVGPAGQKLRSGFHDPSEMLVAVAATTTIAAAVR